ncbi:MAG: hypothetical protein C0392_14700 [Syntrophus sp. (in: bacteria)]|nr:hypothetical protein [Syntrophus sp. (in: bacteria)]
MTTEHPVYIRRFNRFQRVMHIIVMTSFLGLALTGIPLKYSDKTWAHYLVSFIGGFESAGYIHRVLALVTFGYFLAHLVYLFIFFRYKSQVSFLAFLTGPDSMVPRLQDLKDMYRNVKWFLGCGPKPEFDRWTYWEKFDYWAVFWGVAMIGISGLFLWFPTFFASFLPGWTLNIATIVHSDEAFLAIGFIFVFHYIHTHLRGEKFPFDEVIFTGRLSEEEFLKERPAEHARAIKGERIETLMTGPPKHWFRVISVIIGFIALATGITIISLMIGSLF